MSIAYNQPYAATDGNVIRVLSRIYNLSENMRLDKHKKNVHQLNQSLIDNAIPHIYTQAIMELGALLCLPRNPRCKICPVKGNCFAFMHNKQDTLPFIEKQSKKKEHNYICLVIRQGKHIILQKRNQPLLEGMYEYPQFKSKSFNQVQKDLKKSDVQISLIKKGLVYKHIFTHQIWTMQVYYVSLLEGSLEHWISVKKNDIYNYPMAIAHRKIDNCNF